MLGLQLLRTSFTRASWSLTNGLATITRSANPTSVAPRALASQTLSTRPSIFAHNTSLLSHVSSSFRFNRSFSTSPVLGAKRDTYNPSRRIQKRRHGFLARVKSRTGRQIIARRRARGKKALSW